MAKQAKGLGLDIRAIGDDVAQRTVYGLAKRGEDPRPAFKKIIEDLRGLQPAWFASQGEGSWPSLADGTRRQKEARGQQPDRVLVATGDLLRSLTVKRGAKGRRSATKRQMRFGTNVYYARFHKMGAGVPVRNPLIPVDTRTRRKMVHDVRDYMTGKNKGVLS